MMRKLVLTILLLVLFSIFTESVTSIENPAINNPSVRNPVGSPLVPPSSRTQGLIRSPNPIDRSSNLVITGNVSGGKHFRGAVPYNAITDFGGSLGSTDLDSFLRKSASSGEFSHFRYNPKPYYSNTGTVTSLRYGVSTDFVKSSPSSWVPTYN